MKLGLAMAAQGATQKVKGLLEDDQEALADLLDRMHEEASETEERCTALAGEFEGKKTAILEQARETKQSATEMMQTYLEWEDDALDGFEFLTMAVLAEHKLAYKPTTPANRCSTCWSAPARCRSIWSRLFRRPHAAQQGWGPRRWPDPHEPGEPEASTVVASAAGVITYFHTKLP